MQVSAEAMKVEDSIENYVQSTTEGNFALANSEAGKIRF